MRGSKGALGQEAGCRFEQPGDGVDGRRSHRFLERRRREDTGQAAGQQGLAGAGRTDEQQVVAPGCSNLERPPRAALASDVDEVERGACWRRCGSFRRGWHAICVVDQIRDDLRQ